MLHYHKQQKGLVLLMTLIFMQILMGMSLVSYYATQFNKKILHQFLQHLQSNHHALNLLYQLSQKIDVSQCRITLINPVKLFEKPTTWWQTNACLGQEGENKYFYVNEFLGNDGCSFIQGNDCSADYYRVSLLWRGESPEAVNRLQSTIATCSDKKPTCESPHSVLKGVQMHREINF